MSLANAPTAPFALDERPVRESTDPLLGRILPGGVQLLAPIAEGAMGRVFRGKQLKVNRDVAVKVLSPDGNADELYSAGRSERFRREALATSRLSHPHTVQLIDAGRTRDGLLFLVLELVPGDTLAHHLEQVGYLEPLRALRITAQIARSLIAAHRAHIVHRDLKPENVLICHYPGLPDFVKVMDFGIAHILEAEFMAHRLTSDGMVLGSPAYMAPERAFGREVGPRSDLYSLGVALYEMLTGRVPFEGETFMKVIKAHQHEPVPPLDLPSHERGLVRQLDRLLDRLLSKEPERRPRSAGAVLAEIETLERLALLGSDPWSRS